MIPGYVIGILLLVAFAPYIALVVLILTILIYSITRRKDNG